MKPSTDGRAAEDIADLAALSMLMAHAREEFERLGQIACRDLAKTAIAILKEFLGNDFPAAADCSSLDFEQFTI